MGFEDKQEIDWAAHSEAVLLALFGEPDQKHKSGKEWRWRKKGSLSIDTERGLFTDHENGEWGGIYDLIRRETGLSGRGAVDWLRKECPSIEISYTTRAELEKRRQDHEAERAKREAWKAGKAKEIWDTAKPLPGTLAGKYLTGRDVSGAGSDFLRFDPACHHSGLKAVHPAMIGGVSVWPSDTVTAIHRTYLDGDGRKLAVEGQNAKMMLGSVTGGAVRLSGTCQDAESALVLCEGIETGLSLAAATSVPVWAALSTSGIKAVVLPPADQVRRIIIAADHDKSRAGIKAAEARALALRQEGREVLIALPPEAGQDFNDLHRAAGIEAVRRALDAAKPFDPDPVPRLLNDENWPFMVNEKGVFYLAETTNRDGEAMREYRFLSTPLHVEAVTHSGDGTGWGRRVCVVNSLGQKKRVVISAADISEGSRGGVFRTLAAHGADVKTSKALRDKLLDYLTEARPEKRLICAERIGWHEASGAFVLPDQSFGGDPETPVIYAPEEGAGLPHPYRVKGTLEEWQARVAIPCRGNSRLVFSLCVAAAGPLLHLVDGEGGVFHFSGPSSIGKSTMLAVAGSFWGGGGIHGFRDTWRATDNALESKAMAHSDTLICLDELGQAEAHAAQRATYMLAQGAGKARMGKAGESRAVMEWRINGLSSGEIGMADKLAEGRSKFTLKDGQEARFVEIPADAGAGLGVFEALGQFATPAAMAGHFREMAAEIYGAPGRALLEALTADRVKLTGQGRESVRLFRLKLEQKGAVAAVDRVATRFAIVATAGALAVKKGILPFTKDEVEAAVITCFRAWLRQRGGVGSREVYEGAARVVSFIEQYGPSRFQNWETDHNQKVDRRAGFRKLKDVVSDEGFKAQAYDFYLHSDVLKGEVLKGLNAKACVAGMVEMGVIDLGGGQAAKVIWVPSEGRLLRLYPITDKIFTIE